MLCNADLRPEEFQINNRDTGKHLVKSSTSLDLFVDELLADMEQTDRKTDRRRGMSNADSYTERRRIV